MEMYEKERNRFSATSEMDQEVQAENQAVLVKALRQLEEDEDEIKKMNELILNAKCVTIRDAQVQEKLQIKMERKREDIRLDTMMENERQRDVEKIRERERRKHDEQRLGASVIRKQIEERHEAALLQTERRDQEIKAAMTATAAQDELDRQLKLVKMEQQRVHLQNIQAANIRSIQHRKDVAIAEVEEDKKVMRYVLEREKQQQERDTLDKSRKLEKEKELGRLRAQQQKVPPPPFTLTHFTNR